MKSYLNSLSYLRVALVAICLGSASTNYVEATESSDASLIEGVPEHLLFLRMKQQSSASDSSKGQQLYAHKRRWEPGQIVRVCYFGGGPSVRKLIADTATEWTSHANIKLDFGAKEYRDCFLASEGFSHIRIGFGEQGAWSAIGRESIETLNPYMPSMNFGGYDNLYAAIALEDVTAKAELAHKAVILHEFGHALGLLHEHQNPKIKCYNEIKWDGERNIFDILQDKPYYWGRQKVIHNFGAIDVIDSDYEGIAPDKDSIMIYAMMKEILKKGEHSHCFTRANNRLSRKDKEVIAKLYPHNYSSTSDETNIKPALNTLAVVNTVGSAALAEDNRTRIFVDLDSDDTGMRRDARVRLASYLGTIGKEQITSIVAELMRGSYRRQLGLAVALASGAVKDAPQNVVTELKLLASKSKDTTLKTNLLKAAAAVE